ncbi:AraC-type DNA-binding protein [Kaistia soli DSM 19436]|uniref:AraC-type DNA-binding protein n=1 Tax=Kaistia soli DSM 19436 TaxID=1122133 RepID=A0A1M5G0N9_9HYPH|nr:helix-turn-helix domain-containing protein [Kaistia soli]SHF97214.1 AraC-type DNA-binding protein [Kaistia soli DSM 19436]
MTVSGFGWRDLSTDAVPAAERLDYWREATNSLFPPTQLRRDGFEGFYGHVAWLSLGEVTIADIVSTSLDVVRSERDIHCGDDRWYELTIQIDGECAFSQDGRDIVTGPRSMVLYDSRRPYQMRFRGPYRQVSLKVPRAALRERVPSVDRLVALHLAADRIPGRFIYDLASGLCERPNDIPAALSSRLEQHVLELTATALMDVGSGETVSFSRVSQLDRIKAYILAHLDDAELSPRGIAAAHGISLRRLYELFEGEEQQVARFVQAQRLDRIRRELADPLMRGLPINSIALRRGFKDFSHFSRAFRRQFGVAPGAFRSASSH